MRRAMALAQQAQDRGEVPVGALVVRGDDILGEGFNAPIGEHDPTAHAEIQALRQAAKRIGNYRLVGASLIVTLEPCAMCLGALYHARIRHLCFGAHDPKTGAAGGAFDLTTAGLPHKLEVTGGVLAEENSDRLKSFFSAKRQVAE